MDPMTIWSPNKHHSREKKKYKYICNRYDFGSDTTVPETK